MTKPTIEINGKTYEIKKIKPRDWREFFKFDAERGEQSLSELMTSHCEILAKFFDGVTADDLLDGAEMSDVLKTYHGVRTYLMEKVTSKLGTDTKNADEGAVED